MPLFEAVPTLLLLAAGLFGLGWCARQISLRTQLVVYYLTGSADHAALAIFLLLLPGVFVHELAHWLAAKLVGLRTGKFRVWPTRQKTHIGLGSVTVQRGGPWRDAFVGIAPLVAGTALLALIGAIALQSDLLLGQLEQGRLIDTLGAFFQAFTRADALLWSYLLFTIGNSMMPSRSDREPLKLVWIYVVFAVLVYFVVGLPIDPVTLLLGWVIPAFELVVSGVLFTILLDALVLAVLYPAEALLAMRRQG